MLFCKYKIYSMNSKMKIIKLWLFHGNYQVDGSKGMLTDYTYYLIKGASFYTILD